MNRSQRRRQQSRQRGVGFTRQFSSRRARLQHGTDQKLSRKYVELLKAIREALKAQAQVSEPEGPETFDLLGPDESVLEDVPFTPEELSPEEWELLDGYLEFSAKDLSAQIAAGNFDGILTEMRSREEDRKSRITVLKALDARMKVLGDNFVFNTSGVVPPEGVIFGQTTAAELAARRLS